MSPGGPANLSSIPRTPRGGEVGLRGSPSPYLVPRRLFPGVSGGSVAVSLATAENSQLQLERFAMWKGRRAADTSATR